MRATPDKVSHDTDLDVRRNRAASDVWVNSVANGYLDIITS